MGSSNRNGGKQGRDSDPKNTRDAAELTAKFEAHSNLPSFCVLPRFVCADVEDAAERNRIPEEVTRPDRAAAQAGTRIRAAVDRRRPGLQRPLRCRSSDPVVAEAVHQPVLVV